MTLYGPRRAPLTVAAMVALLPSRAFGSGAVEAVAQEAAQGIAQAPATSVVVAAPFASDQAAPRGDDLAVRVAALVAGKLGAGAHAQAQAVPLGTARALAGRARALVYVQTEVSKGDVRATIDVYPSMANAWDRIRNPIPAPTGHAFSTAKIDAEVRSFLAPLVLEQATVHKARHDEGDVLAAGCGDVDGDGGDELVLVSRARVALGRVRGGRFVAERTAAWTELAPRSPVPMREPLAGAVVRTGAVDVGSTDRGSVALTPDFTTHSPLAGVPAWVGDGLVCLTTEPSAGAFDATPLDCAASHDDKPRLAAERGEPGAALAPPTSRLALIASRFDALGASTVVDAAGEPRSVVALREPDGKLRVAVGDAVTAPDGPFGTQLAVADLDQDGVPDIATSVDGADDAVNVFSWAGASADLRGRLHLAAPGGVHALAVCPPEDGGAPVLVAVVGNEVWLVRAAVRGGLAGKGEVPAIKRTGQ